MKARGIAAAVLFALSPAIAVGQPAPRPRAEPTLPNAAASLDGPAPPYEGSLNRLAELMGALTYLRDLCGLGGGEYRTRMAALLDAETPTGPRRDRIAGYFNRGFREYELMHRTCTPVSREVVRRATDEAGGLARTIGNRFGAS